MSIYYALIPIIGGIAIAIIVFTFVMFGNCAILPWLSTLPGPTTTSSGLVSDQGSSARLNLSPYSASSFKISKRRLPENVEEANEETTTTTMECVVCLLAFEDDEVIRQLHGCKHSFHAPCIDMWMYSHSNCPICRNPVDRRAGLDDFTSDDNSSYMEVVSIDDISIPSR